MSHIYIININYIIIILYSVVDDECVFRPAVLIRHYIKYNRSESVEGVNAFDGKRKSYFK
jgi:hypothetical protein